MIQQAHPHTVCLQETKLSQIDDRLSLEILGQSCWRLEYLPADETRGGIAIAWNRDFITCHSLKPGRKDYSLSTQITLNLTNSSFLLTAVYRPTEHSEKMNFLAELISCQPTQPTPWICLGDFKLIYEARDKNNGNINRALMSRFR